VSLIFIVDDPCLLDPLLAIPSHLKLYKTHSKSSFSTFF